MEHNAVMTSADEATLERIVGAPTFARGRAYARQGAVRSSRWTHDGACLVGEVQGSVFEPYVVEVRVTTSTTGRMTGVDGACTCPVGYNCKHAVALLLADSSRRSTDGPARTVVGGDAPADRTTSTADPGTRQATPAVPPSPSSDWEDSLRSLVWQDPSRTADRVDRSTTELGLQFELVLTPPPSQYRSDKTTTGIRLRPVVRKAGNGTWVRSGISWARLEQPHYGRPPFRSRAHLTILTELLALSRLVSPRTYYSSSDEVGLAPGHQQPATVGPVARGGRPPAPAAADRPATWAGRAPGVPGPGGDGRGTRGGGHRPATPGRRRRRGRADPVGVVHRRTGPRHRLVGASSRRGADPAQLFLSALESPIDDSIRTLLATTAIRIPPRDEERFLRDLYPALRRRIVVGSSDGSVELPELPAARLVLAVHHGEGHQLELTWSRSAVGATWTEELWDAPSRMGDRVAENLIVHAVTAIVGAVPGLLEPTLAGERLAPRATLAGMAAVRFTAEVLPALEGVDGVEVVQRGELLEYREVLDAPVVNLGGAPSERKRLVRPDRDGDGGRRGGSVRRALRGTGRGADPSDPAVGDVLLPRPRGAPAARSADRRGPRRSTTTPGESLRLSRFQASLWEDLQQLGVVTAQAREWEQSVRALTEARQPDRAPGARQAARDPPAVPAHRLQLAGLPLRAPPGRRAGRRHGARQDGPGAGAHVPHPGTGPRPRRRSWWWRRPAWSATGRPRAAGSPRTSAGHRHRDGKRRGRRRSPKWRPGPTWSSRPTRCSGSSTTQYAAIAWAGLLPGRGAVRQEPRLPGLPAGAELPAPVQGGDDRDADGEQPDGAVVAAVDHRPGLFPSPDRFTDHYRTPIEKQAGRRAPGPAAPPDPPADAAPDQGAGRPRPPRQAGAGPRAGAAPEAAEALPDVPAAGAPEGARPARRRPEATGSRSSAR